jgi:hypothetical protein
MRIDTLEKLASAIYKLNPETTTTENTVLRFLASAEADQYDSNFDRRDWADLLLYGQKPMSERWRDVLGTLGGVSDGECDYDEEGMCFPTFDDIEYLMKILF